jgi:hypothetical protein
MKRKLSILILILAAAVALQAQRGLRSPAIVASLVKEAAAEGLPDGSLTDHDGAGLIDHDGNQLIYAE